MLSFTCAKIVCVVEVTPMKEGGTFFLIDVLITLCS